MVSKFLNIFCTINAFNPEVSIAKAGFSINVLSITPICCLLGFSSLVAGRYVSNSLFKYYLNDTFISKTYVINGWVVVETRDTVLIALESKPWLTTRLRGYGENRTEIRESFIRAATENSCYKVPVGEIRNYYPEYLENYSMDEGTYHFVNTVGMLHKFQIYEALQTFVP
jgi:hypothetical protein